MKNNNIIKLWLGSLCFMVVFIIFLGGLTRLEGAGLSITKWMPISGILPPINDQDWENLFDEYKKIPQYNEVNFGMSLEEFKYIFWLEFLHRIAGRMVFLLLAIPLIYFASKKIITKSEIKLLSFAMILVLIQGFVGWYMVSSGVYSTNNLTSVSPYRLVFHLMMAITIYIIFFITLLGRFSVKRFNESSLFRFLLGVTALFLIQISLGGIVAGTKAGLLDHASFSSVVENSSMEFIKNLDLIQLLHKYTGYLVFILAFVFFYKAKNFKLISTIILTLIFLQVIFGIITLATDLNKYIAILHQVFAIITLSSLIFGCYILYERGGDKN